MMHLWRSYQVPPYDRFALTIEYDPKAEYGYRITDFDPAVADASFIAAFNEHMRLPTLVGFPISEKGEEGHHWEHAGTEKHCYAAARTFPRGTVCGRGRRP